MVRPARAGVDPERPTGSAMIRSDPRARGWTQSIHETCGQGRVRPARAGVDPQLPHPGGRRLRPTRARGGGPCSRQPRGRTESSDPRARGWTPTTTADSREPLVRPARAGVDRAGARCCRGAASPTPRARGWTADAVDLRARRLVRPARAGVDPSRGQGRPPGRGPTRARGGGPSSDSARLGQLRSDPRARGWTGVEYDALADVGVRPARAGVDPSPAARRPCR